MILPADHESMTDEELEAALIESGIYDAEAAVDVVAMVRGDAEPLD